MLVAAAVCPCPPLLVPEVAAGAAPELDDLRADCDRAVAALLDARPEVVVVLGGGPVTAAAGPGDAGSLAGFGVDLTVVLGSRLCTGRPGLPLSLTIGAWLLGRSPWTGETTGLAVRADADDAEAARHGADLAALADRVGALVLADGTARRTPKAPGSFDDRAEPFDAALAATLAEPDPAALAGLDPGLCAELGVSGRAALAVLGHAAEEGAAEEGAAEEGAAADGAGPPWRAELLHASAPYGVGYLVASWRRDPDLPAGSAAP